MRLRGVRIRVPEGTLMCRTHTTQHELSAIAPNFQWVQLLASLGFADIGATNPEVAACALPQCHMRPDIRSARGPRPGSCRVCCSPWWQRGVRG